MLASLHPKILINIGWDDGKWFDKIYCKVPPINFLTTTIENKVLPISIQGMLSSIMPT